MLQVRRLADADSRVYSLRRLIVSIADHNSLVTRRAFLLSYPRHHRHLAAAQWQRYTKSANAVCLPHAIPQEDLLVLARSDEGRLLLRVERHDARTLLDAVAGRNDARASAVGRELEVVGPEEQVFAGDRVRLEQALGNLVDNALRYGEGTIRLEARTEGGQLVFVVRDQGEGFSPEFLPHAFERFTRADVSRAGGGTGLGLAIVDAIAGAHGGSAAAANADGGGAQVTLTIPALDSEP